MAFAVVVISLPRLYVGLHDPTDIIGGAVSGLVCALASQQPALRARLARPSLDRHARAPYSFYAFGWYFLFGLANMFQDLRRLLKAVLQALRG